jgi:copper chaperone CopZ
MQRKITLALVVLLALATAVFAAGSTTEKISLKIEGMDCGKCAEKIETALKSVDGVKDAHVSLLKETADVEAAQGVTVASLTEAVNKVGYAVAGQKNTAEHKAGDCGKKCPMMEKHKEHG